MKKAGEVIALIGGIFAVFAALFTLFFGGVASAFEAEGSQTIIGLGWGGIGFSFLVIILSAVGLGTSSRVTSILLIIASIAGAILGGTAVAIFMALALIGGILALIGTKGNKPTTNPELKTSTSKKTIIIIAVVSLLFMTMVISAVVRNNKPVNSESSEIAASSTNSEIAEKVVDEPKDCKFYIPNLKRTNLFITAVDKAETFDPTYYDNAFPGKTGQSLLVPAFPGKLIIICKAKIYYSDSSNAELVFTVSEMEDKTIHVMTQDNAAILPSLNAMKMLIAQNAEEKKADVGLDSAIPSPTHIEELNGKPSFDCSNAHGFVEQTICGDSELAKLDVEMHDAYIRMKEKVDETQLKKEQLDWMNQRNQCKDIQCIKTAYQVRITQFAAESE